jgi:amino acid transporter
VAVSLSPNRPRNVDWRRAAALLYGDWGTSKAYVIGLAFAAAQFSSFPIIIAVCLLTAFVGYNYVIVCRNFPDGGGVYSAARSQSRLLAAVGALLLIANFIVTASLSGWAAMSYFGVPQNLIPYATMGTIVLLGVVNFFGPKHSGSMAVGMAVPTVICVVAILAFSIPNLTTNYLEWPTGGFSASWVNFVKAILALSGVEAIANMTGVMRLDPNSTAEKPRVVRTASMALFVVALEVVLGTVLLGWATLSLPKDFTPQLMEHKEDMLRFLGQHFAGIQVGPAFGSVFGWIVGLVFGVLLLSAVNTAIVAVIGVMYMMALDGEFPRPLNPAELVRCTASATRCGDPSPDPRADPHA